MQRIRYSFGSRHWDSGGSLARIQPRRSLPFKDIVQRGSHIALIGMFALATILALDSASAYMVPVCAAILTGLTLGPLVDWFERRRVNPYFASAGTILGIGAIIGLLFFGVSGSLEEWGRKVPLMWERATDEFRILKEPLEGFDETLNSVFDASEPAGGEVTEVKITEGSLVAQLFSIVPMVGGQIVIFIGTLFFFLASRTRIRLSVLSFCMDGRARLRTARIFRDIEFFLSRYVASITVVNIGLGFATGIAMALLGLPSPVLWGLLAAVLNFVPYLGPLIMALILSGVGLVVHDTLWAALLPATVFLTINFVEAQFVTPSVIGRALTINPLSVFLALTFWLWLWGPIGALVAVPMLIVGLVVTVHVLPRRTAVGRRRLGAQRRTIPAEQTSVSPEPALGEASPIGAGATVHMSAGTES